MAEKHPKRPRDLNQWAKRMVDIATGDESDAPAGAEKKPAQSKPTPKPKNVARKASAKKA